MRKIPVSLTWSWLILIILSMITGVFGLAGWGDSSWYEVSLTVIALVKIMIVAYYFMELRHAHSLWPKALWILMLITSGLILVLLLM